MRDAVTPTSPSLSRRGLPALARNGLLVTPETGGTARRLPGDFNPEFVELDLVLGLRSLRRLGWLG